MKKRQLLIITTLLLLLLGNIQVYAGTKEYSLSAIDVILQIPDSLNVLTRNVSDGNPALSVLKSDSNTIKNSFVKNHIYLDAFPDDLSYEIMVIATPYTEKENADFAQLTENDLKPYCDSIKEKIQANEQDEFIGLDIYSNSTTKFIKTDLHNTGNDASTYIQEYQTIQNGFHYHFRLQSNAVEVNDELAKQLQSIVDSAQFTKVKASITDSSAFMNIMETLIGFALTVGVLGLFILLSTRKPKA